MNHSPKELKLIFITLSAVTVLSIAVAAGFAALYLSGKASAGNFNDTAIRDDTAESDAVDGSADQTADAALAALQNENEALRQKAQSLEEAIAQLLAEAEAAETEYVPADDSVISGSFDPGDLTPADPDSLSYTFDLTEQLARIRALEEKMENSPFLVDPDGNLVKRADISFDDDTEIIYRAAAESPLDADGKPTETEIDYAAMGYTSPTVALSYRDLERGTSYSYHGDTVFFSASLIKAPYVYTLLDQIAQYNAIKKANPTNDPAKGKTLSQETWDKYDLSRKITLTESMKAEGSGKIKDMDLTDGKEFTVLELIEYAIKVSDNTAFRILRNEFGYDYFWAVSRKLGVESVFTSFNNMTADEACLYLAAIYDFAKEYPYEGGILISLMKNANHQVLITQAVERPGNVAHKYGWDTNSYHDMAIVYGEAPFAVAVMTNFDFAQNDDDINEYIRSLVSEIEAIHKAFYGFGKTAS